MARRRKRPAPGRAPEPRRLPWLMGAVVSLLLIAFTFAAPRLLDDGAGSPAPPATSGRAADPVERLRVRVLASYPHDPEAFTQGLLWHEGAIFESTGHYGHSSLRRYDLETGAVVLHRQLDPDLFGEGLARVGERLIQLTWRAGVALVYRLSDLHEEERRTYVGEGWGLCFDGERLVMSDGSHVLTLRDPQTMAPVGTLEVTRRGSPLDRLNELECAEGFIYANVYQTDEIVRIDPRSGRVRATIDASGLLTPEQARAAQVLNGIAYRPTTGTFLLTGKHWPRIFEVELVGDS